MSDVAQAMQTLDAYAQELDQLSKSLAQVERDLVPVHEEVTRLMDEYELGLYHRSVQEADYKLPAESIRVKLARRSIAPELYGRHTALVASRDRMQQRIRDLRLLVDAQRSILSAWKSEAEASRGVQPQWSQQGRQAA